MGIERRIWSEHDKKRCYPWAEDDTDLLVPIEHERKEEREEYRDRQLSHHFVQRLQRQKEKEKRQERRMSPHEHPFRSQGREVRRCRSYVRGLLAKMDDCVLR